MERQRFVSRHELWRGRYRNVRDLDHLRPEALSERLFDCMNNARARTEQGQLGLVPMPLGEDWWIRFTEVLEECALRRYDYPGPINVSGYADALEHAFAPIPNVAPYLGRLKRGGYLMKFGKSERLRSGFEKESSCCRPPHITNATSIIMRDATGNCLGPSFLIRAIRRLRHFFRVKSFAHHREKSLAR